MKTLVFYGASDDLMEVEEVGGAFAEEFPGELGVFLVVSGEQQAKVRLRYERNGCWSIAVWQAAEGIKLPPATLTTHERDYSALLTLEAADTVSVHRLAAEEDED